MKQALFFSVLLGIFVFLGLILYRIETQSIFEKEKQKSKESEGRSSDPHSYPLSGKGELGRGISGSPDEYFPAEIGDQWEYEVTVSKDHRPLQYRETAWKVGEKKSVIMATRGYFFGSLTKKKASNYVLKYRVVEKPKKKGPLLWPGVRLEIVKDDFDIFDDHKEVFFVFTGSRFSALLLVTYDPSRTPGAPRGSWGSWAADDGYTLRHLMFADKPMTGLSMGKSKDKLIFIGPDPLSKYGRDVLHFRRKIEEGEPKNRESGKVDYLNKGFTEDTWFVRGKGLVRLIQKVDGHETMRWELKKFERDR